MQHSTQAIWTRTVYGGGDWVQMLSSPAPDLRPPALVRVSAVAMDRLFTDRSRPDFVRNLMLGTDAEAYDAREILEETARLIPDCTLQLHEGKGDMGAESTMQLPRDVLAWIEERSRVRTRSEAPRPAPITEETVPAASATTPEPSLAGAGAG